MNKKFSKIFVSNLVLTPILLTLIYKLFGLSGGWQTAFGVLYILTIAFTAVTTLEVECQKATADYNIYLKTFPNNIYNLFIGKKPIVYKYGFTSDSTQAVFKSGIEN